MESADEDTGPVNLGNPVEMTVRELAELIVAKTGSDGGFELLDLPADDPKRRQPDITKARELLGWEPEVPLDRGLDQTIRYFQELES
jgi:UDP-glucuronate decarboxylase